MKNILLCSLFFLLLCQSLSTVARDFACPVIAAFSPLNTTAYSDTTVNFTNNSTGATSYQWLVNDEVKGTGANFTYTFTGAGDYIIKLRALDAGCSDSTIGAVSINYRSRPVTYVKSHSTQLDSLMFRNTLETSDGNLLFIGSKADQSGILTKMTKNGTIIWHRTYNGSGSGNEMITAANTPGNGFVVAGFSRRGADNGVITLINFNEAGKIVWEKEYAGDNQSYLPVKIVQSSDGHIYLLCRLAFGSQDDVFILKFTGTGDLVWNKRYRPDNGLIITPTDMTELGDNLFISGSSDKRGVMMRVAKNSGAPGSTNIYRIGTDANVNFTQIIPFENYLLLSVSPQSTILGLGQTGSIALNFRPFEISRGTGMKVAVYEGIIYAVSSYGTDSIAIAQKRNLFSSTVWHRQYFRPGKWNSNYFSATEDGIMAAATGVAPLGNFEHAIFRINAEGFLPACLPQTVTTSFDAPGTAFSKIEINAEDIVMTAASHTSTITAPGFSMQTDCYDDEGVKKCKASFGPVNVFAKSDTTITFTSSSTNITNYEWSVNDVVQGTNASFTHHFTGDGDYKVKLRAYTLACSDAAYGAVVIGDTTKSLTYKKIYKRKYDSNVFNHTLATSDGHLLITGTHINYLSMMTKVTKGGTILWQKIFQSTEPYYSYRYNTFNCAANTNDNAVVVAGSSFRENTSREISLTKLDLSGNILWEKLYGNGTSYNNPVGIVYSSDGFIFLVCHSNNNVLLIKISNDGTLVWSKVYTASGVSLTAYDMFEKGNDIIIAGTCGTQDPQPVVGGFVIKAAKNNGDAVWAKRYYVPGEDMSFKQIFSSGSHFIVNAPSHLSILKLDLNGQLVAKARPWAGPSTHDMRLGVYKDTQIVVANYSRTPEYALYIFGLAGFDADLNMKWNNNWLDHGRYSIRTVMPTGNDIFVSVIDARPAEMYYNTLMRFNQQGLLPSCLPDTVGETGSLPDISITDVSISAADYHLADSLHGFIASTQDPSFETTCFDNGKCVRINLGSDTLFCSGTSITLRAGSNFLNYVWQDGSTIDSLVVTTPGSYWIQVTDSNQCVSRDTIIISVATPGYLNLGTDTTICPDKNITLHAGTPFVNYVWQDGSTSESLAVTAPGTYWVHATSSNQCISKDTIVITPSTECPQAIYFPNAFTPNNDGHNDVFRSIIKGHVEFFQFTVFNRQGGILFESTDPSQGWDGKIKGLAARRDTYIWVCTYKFTGQEQKRERGTVTLLR